MYFIVLAIISNVVWAVVAWRINKGWSNHCKEIEAEMYTWKARTLVRCKDCKHHHPIDYCDERDGIWNDNDYCSFAERQEE